MAIAEFKLKGLTGREYKMLLKPARFKGPAKAGGKRFWTRRLAPIVAGHWKAPSNGSFDALFGERVRVVRFYDTDERDLDAHDYSLRLREDKNGTPKSEVTLKLRTSDIFASGLAKLSAGKTGKDEELSEKFEEDIAPLEVQAKAKQVKAPPEPSTRRRFSRSTQRERAEAYQLARFKDATRLFPSLGPNLEALAAAIPPGTALSHGPVILEYVFEAKHVVLIGGIKVDIALTLWYFDRDSEPDARTTPKVAEISFQWNTPKKSAVTLAKTQCARALFRDMQQALKSWISMEDSSKTELALPPRKKSSRAGNRTARQRPVGTYPSLRASTA